MKDNLWTRLGMRTSSGCGWTRPLSPMCGSRTGTMMLLPTDSEGTQNILFPFSKQWCSQLLQIPLKQWRHVALISIRFFSFNSGKPVPYFSSQSGAIQNLNLPPFLKLQSTWWNYSKIKFYPLFSQPWLAFPDCWPRGGGAFQNSNFPALFSSFLDDRVNRIIGYAVVRQVREKIGDCQAPSLMRDYVESCTGDLSIPLLNEDDRWDFVSFFFELFMFLKARGSVFQLWEFSLLSILQYCILVECWDSDLCCHERSWMCYRWATPHPWSSLSLIRPDNPDFSWTGYPAVWPI